MTRVFFSGLAIIIDNYPTPIEPGTLSASIVNGAALIANSANGEVLAAPAWQSVADASGDGFDSSDATLAYLSAQFSALPPPRLSSVRVATADPVMILPSDGGGLVGVRKTQPSPTVISLPDDEASGFYFGIKDMRGDAATNAVTLTTALVVDGESQYALVENWQGATLYRVGDGWSVM